MNQNNPNPNQPQIETTRNYRAELTFDDEVTCSITGSTLQSVQGRIAQLLPGPKLRFGPANGEDADLGGTLAIYHESHFGNQPIGWIALYDVPTNMSVKSVTRARLGASKAA